jgi:hypothetical protein
VVPGDSNILASTSEETAAADYHTDIAFKLNKPSSSDDDYESMPLCKSSIRKINPHDLVRARGYDIVDNEKFTQIIEVNVCENVGASCALNMPQLFKKSVCRQKTMKISLKVTLKNNQSFLEDFDIPSQCECATYNRIF